MPVRPSPGLTLEPFALKGKWEPSEQADKLRIGITWLFSVALVIFLGVFLFGAVTIQSPGIWTQMKEAFGIILPALTGTLGTVIGFYFGSKDKPQ
jgi:hypothetical protein